MGGALKSYLFFIFSKNWAYLPLGSRATRVLHQLRVQNTRVPVTDQPPPEINPVVLVTTNPSFWREAPLGAITLSDWRAMILYYFSSNFPFSRALQAFSCSRALRAFSVPFGRSNYRYPAWETRIPYTGNKAHCLQSKHVLMSKIASETALFQSPSCGFLDNEGIANCFF